MREYQLVLIELLVITEEIVNHAQSIDPNMNKNEPEQLEKLQLLVEQRDNVIKQLDTFIAHPNHHWTEEDRKTIDKLKTHNQTLQPLLNNLYQSFLKQMNRINQTKQVSKKYINAYQTISTDGSFIDKRK